MVIEVAMVRVRLSLRMLLLFVIPNQSDPFMHQLIQLVKRLKLTDGTGDDASGNENSLG